MQTCPICIQLIDNDLLETKCKHYFHSNCLNCWLEKSVNCPMCRKIINKNITDVSNIEILNYYQILLNLFLIISLILALLLVPILIIFYYINNLAVKYRRINNFILCILFLILIIILAPIWIIFCRVIDLKNQFRIKFITCYSIMVNFRNL